MYIAMNRFKINLGKEEEFIETWRTRDSYLDQVPGFKQFNMLRGPQTESYTLFISHSQWENEQAFRDWTRSEEFRKAHASRRPATDIHSEPPQFEGYSTVL